MNTFSSLLLLLLLCVPFLIETKWYIISFEIDKQWPLIIQNVLSIQRLVFVKKKSWYNKMFSTSCNEHPSLLGFFSSSSPFFSKKKRRAERGKCFSNQSLQLLNDWRERIYTVNFSENCFSMKFVRFCLFENCRWHFFVVVGWIRLCVPIATTDDLHHS